MVVNLICCSCFRNNLLDKTARDLLHGPQEVDVNPEGDMPRCRECDSNVCSCEDTRQSVYFPSDEEYSDQLERESCFGVAAADGLTQPGVSLSARLLLLQMERRGSGAAPMEKCGLTQPGGSLPNLLGCREWNHTGATPPVPRRRGSL